MKKVLLATTALVVSAGVAQAAGHAEVTVSVGGGADLGVRDLGTITEAVATANIDFSGSGETDGGLGFGFSYTIITGDNGTTTGGIDRDDMEVYISGSWGKLTIGDVDNALQKVAGIDDIGFKGLGVDDRAETARGSGSAGGVLYSNTIGPVSIYLSHGRDLDNDDFGAGVSFSAGDIKVGLGYTDAGAAGDVTALDVSGSFGSVGFDVYYEDADATDSHYGAIFSFDAGMTTVNLGYSDGDSVGDARMGVGFAYDLGGGATLEGGVADNGTDTVWDLGVEMTF